MLGAAPSASRVARRKKLISRTATTFLVAAVIGVATWFVFSAVSGATLIVFRTGSMSPTMPQGSVAVSMPVSADEIDIGDVVTVQPANRQLPVTHRVVEVREVAVAAHEQEVTANARELVLKGDDNDTADIRPYVVTEARRAVFAVPALGSALMLLQSPIGMGVLTLVAGALTAWAFWPRRRQEPPVTP